MAAAMLLFWISTTGFISGDGMSGSREFLLAADWHSSVKDGEKKWIAVL